MNRLILILGLTMLIPAPLPGRKSPRRMTLAYPWATCIFWCQTWKRQAISGRRWEEWPGSWVRTMYSNSLVS